VDPVWQRTFRIFIGPSSAGSFISYQEIVNLTGLPTSQTLFNNMTVSRIDVWLGADAPPNEPLSVLFYNQRTFEPDRVFTDSGVQGSRRAHVSVAYPQHAVPTVPRDNWTYNIAALPTAITVGAIFDFHVQLWNGPDILFRSSEKMNILKDISLRAEAVPNTPTLRWSDETEKTEPGNSVITDQPEKAKSSGLNCFSKQ
jgi:hypothetical protein